MKFYDVAEEQIAKLEKLSETELEAIFKLVQLEELGELTDIQTISLVKLRKKSDDISKRNAEFLRSITNGTLPKEEVKNEEQA